MTRALPNTNRNRQKRARSRANVKRSTSGPKHSLKKKKNAGPTILVIDDEPSMRAPLRRFLELNGYRVAEAPTVASAIEAFRKETPDLAVVDFMLPDGDALELLPILKHIARDVPLLVLTGHGSIDLAVSLIKAGAAHFLTKPPDLSLLLSLVEELLAPSHPPPLANEVVSALSNRNDSPPAPPHRAVGADTQAADNNLIRESHERDTRLATTPTAPREAKEQLHRSQRMEAIGSLAGGVAHDFNNLLTVILGYAELCLLRHRKGSRTHADLREIQRAAERGAALTRQLLAFSRRQIMQPQLINLNAIVAETEGMLRRLIGEDVELRTSLAPNIAKISADVGQLEQVILNLAINARDAMPDGGALTIATATVDGVAIRQSGTLNPPKGPFVELVVSDTGCGMDEATRARVFEPFFTTKDPGKGTGLGLATVFAIVTQSGGLIDLQSTPGAGTTFRIFFPAAEGLEAAGRSSQKAALPPDLRCLVIEDDDATRSLVAAILERHGVAVVTAADGERGLRAFFDAAEGLGAPDIVITDAVMPELGGLDVLKRIKAATRIPVIVMTGYASEPLSQAFEAGADVVLQKPFAADALVRAVADGLRKTTPRKRGRTPRRRPVGHATAPPPTPALSGQAKFLPVMTLNQPGTTPSDAPSVDSRQAFSDDVSRVIRPRVLIADDDEAVRTFLTSAVEACGCDALAVASGLEAVAVAPEFSPDILLIDYRMPGLTGFETIERLRTVVPDALAIVITGYRDVAVITEALRLSVFDFLEKPITSPAIIHSLGRSIAYREARHRAARQRDFLSLVSHQLRSPLQSPLRYIGNLLDGTYGPLSTLQQERIQRLSEGITTEARLVNNLLDLSYLDAGRFTVRLAAQSVRDAVSSVVRSLELQAVDKQLTLMWAPPKDPYMAALDLEHFKQALGNILCNALEHTAAGKSVAVSIGDGSNGGTVVTIRDEGVGIPPPHLKRIFERNYQAPSSIRRQPRGLGVGLYIANEVVRAHGGQIAVESKLGEGSIFSIILPSSE